MLRPDGGGRVGPFRPADGTKQDRVGPGEDVDVFWPDRHAVTVDRVAAGGDLDPVDGEPERSTGRVHHGDRRGDDLGPDPVAGDQRDPVLRLRHGNSTVRGEAKATSTPLISAPWSLFTATR